MSPFAAQLITLLSALFAGAVIPWLAMQALMPTLERSQRMAVLNYRGRNVVPGLGLVWVVWAVAVFLVGTKLEVLSVILWASSPQQPFSVWIDPGIMPLVLVLGAFALGFADDVYGDGADKGFRGHLSALASGRLSTGGLKLLGIGLLALATAATLASDSGYAPWTSMVVATVLGTLAIALSANLVNLTDLRPGRALKVYSLLVTGLLASWALPYVAGGGSWFDVLPALAVLLGPVFAVWRFDLGERAMLGDAGANAAGALAGWLACVVLHEWMPLAVYVAVLLALNLASERFSFSRVIEGNRVLSWLDGLGRLPVEVPTADTNGKTGTAVEPTEK